MVETAGSTPTEQQPEIPIRFEGEAAATIQQASLQAGQSVNEYIAGAIAIRPLVEARIDQGRLYESDGHGHIRQVGRTSSV